MKRLSMQWVQDLVRAASHPQVAMFAIFIFTLLFAPDAAAGNTGTPWETPMETIQRSISGPVVRYGGFVIIAFFGLQVASGEGGAWKKAGAAVVTGLAIATTGAGWFFNRSGHSGGALF